MAIQKIDKLWNLVKDGMPIDNLVRMQVFGQVENEVWDTVTRQVLYEIEEQVRDDLNLGSDKVSDLGEYSKMVKLQMINQVRDQVEWKVRDQIDDRVDDHAMDQVTHRIRRQVGDQVYIQIRGPVKHQVWYQFRDNLKW